ncbi:MAG: hypothetical protein KY447_00955 [Actinobacteria bacterium]|nr:hypothetical protein [Actinomycetota bacterium]MBW3641464.1 hypothetical protein [Actinomycetota bacterium]
MFAVVVFAVWTVFVWATRVSNIVRDDGSALDLVLAVVLAVLGGAVAVAALRRSPRWPLVALVAATAATWAVRTPLILLDGDHGVAFKAVHAALAVVSIVLAALAWHARPALATGKSGDRRAGAARAG